MDNVHEVPSDTFLDEQVNKIKSIVAQIPPRILWLAGKPPPHVPATGETTVLVTEDTVRYGKRLPPSHPREYEIMWCDAVGVLHETGDYSDGEDDTTHRPVWWRNKDSKWDIRVCGPEDAHFPNPAGWTIDGVKITLDGFCIREATRRQALRMFVTPACQIAWDKRLAFPIPWNKVWKIKSFFATPRDQIPWLKLQHRNLYVAGHDPVDDRCRACSDRESQVHLCECDIIHDEYWSHLLEVATHTGMPQPQDTPTFLATGALSPTTAVSKHHSGILYLGWRCLYAAIVQSRVDGTPLALDKALQRAISMIIGRLRAYGVQWRQWVGATRHTSKPGAIPRKHRNKKVLTQDKHGTYMIHPSIMAKAKALDLTP